jgi:hypothetical protein
MSRRPAALAPLLLAALAIVLPAPAQTVGDQFQVNTYTTKIQYQEAVARDSQGRFIVVWASQREGPSSDLGVYGQRFDAAGVPVGPEFRVNTYTSNAQRFPAIAVDGSGGFVVAWLSSSQYNSDDVLAQRFDVSGAKVGGEFRVNTYTTGQQARPRVAFEPGGSFLVVWSGMESAVASNDVWGQRFDSQGNMLGTEFRVNSYTSRGQSEPDVVADELGNFVVVWSDARLAFTYHVFARRFTSAGAPLGPDFLVSTYTTSSQSTSSVAADAHGDFVVVWATSSGDVADPSGGVFGQRVDRNENLLGDQFHVNTITTNFQIAPRVAMDSAGAFVVTWQNDFSTDISARRYGPLGAPIEDEFRVNTFTINAQETPAVAASPGGAFTIVWEGQTDGALDGIFGQRYSAISPHGDVNGDGVVNTTDVFILINFLFAGGPPPIGVADVNGDGAVTTTDVLYLINFLFAGGLPPK